MPRKLKKMIFENPELGMAIDSRLPYTRAEILWICRNEMPVHSGGYTCQKNPVLISQCPCKRRNRTYSCRFDGKGIWT